MQVTDEMVERAKTAWNSIADEFNQWCALGQDERDTYVEFTAALSDQERAAEVKAGELIERSHVIVEDVIDMALYLRDCPRERIGKYQDAANRLSAFMEEVRSALVDVPVEPVAWLRSCRITYLSGEERDGHVVSIKNDPKAFPVYTHPPHREEEDSAEVSRALAFVARWAWRPDPPNAVRKLTDAERLSAIKYHPTIKALAATRRGSATSSKGCAE